MVAGTNTQRIRSFDLDEPFRDAFKKAREWIPSVGSASNQGYLPINSDGTITSLADASWSTGTLLDDYTGAVAAYSIRKLSASYAGSCMRIREDGDGGETDIGFDSNGLLDESAIAAFCGTNNGFVVVWYDQSGNGYNATAAADANEPKIYDGSTGIHELNGKAALQFDGTDDGLDLPNSVLPANINTCSAFTVQAQQDDGTEGVGLSLGSGNRLYLSHVSAAGAESLGYGSTSSAISIGSASATQKLLTAIAGSTQGDAQVFLDGTSQGSATLVSGTPTTGTAAISPSFARMTGDFQEVVIYHSDKSADRTDIESEIQGYYMPTGTLTAFTLINDNFDSINVGTYVAPNPLYATGDYTLIFEGTGTIRVRGDATDTTYTNGGSYTVTVNTATDSGIRIDLRTTDPSDPVRNIRLLQPGYTTTNTSFDPTDGKRILTDRFKSLFDEYQVVRFMQWLDINSNNFVTNWSDRTPWRAQQSVVGGGVSWEVLTGVMNELGKTAWINVPHQATDAFVTSLATYLRDNLDAEIHFYLEYSNETWNGQYIQYDYCVEQGTARGYTGSDFDKLLKFTSERSKEIFTIFETVFGGRTRFTRVVASQFVNTYTGNLVLSFNNNYTGFDAYAIGPYFGGQASTITTPTTTLDDLYSYLSGQISGNVTTYMAANKVLADQYGVSLLAYEGGQHLVSSAYNLLYAEMNRDARMGTLYTEYLNALNDEDLELFVHYRTNGGYRSTGYWGLQNYEDDSLETLPKKQALFNFFQF